MKNSTGIAERLGAVRFHELLNDFFRDIAEAALECGAEIHKYVGDEAILTWPAERPTLEDDVLACPFVAARFHRRQQRTVSPAVRRGARVPRHHALRRDRRRPDRRCPRRARLCRRHAERRGAAARGRQGSSAATCWSRPICWPRRRCRPASSPKPCRRSPCAAARRRLASPHSAAPRRACAPAPSSPACPSSGRGCCPGFPWAGR